MAQISGAQEKEDAVEVQAGGSSQHPNGTLSRGTGSNDSVYTKPRKNSLSHVEKPEVQNTGVLGHGMLSDLEALFQENIPAKIWRVAARELDLKNPPEQFPEYVPQSGPTCGKYTLREASFWTCGFFPGSLYSILERAMKFPHAIPLDKSDGNPENEIDKVSFHQQLLRLCRSWSEPIYPMASRTDTHDMGFIIQPSLRADWELTGNVKSLEAVLKAAESLSTRYDERVGAIRSWDQLTTKRFNITNLDEDFLVIVDSLCNLDLLFHAGLFVNSPRLIKIATTHAHTVIRTLFRQEDSDPNWTQRPSNITGSIPLYSTYHVVDFSPNDGAVKQRMTAQGYADSSTWARGQAWGILGYAQTYTWTKDRVFLESACGLAEYFIMRLETAPECVEVNVRNPLDKDIDGMARTAGRYVPLWDFDAPILDRESPLRDSTAGVIAANGMLVMHQALSALGEAALAQRYLEMAVKIVRDTLHLSLARDRVKFVAGDKARGRIDAVPVEAEEGKEGDEPFDSILRNATANFNEFDRRRYWDHGLVYADYYLIEFGNRLLKFGLV